MKKTLCLFLSLILILSILCGCNNTEENFLDSSTESSNEISNTNNIPEISVWDGSVATAFAGGDGSAENPYKIASADQFAFLAQEINSGKDYKGKSFSLLCDIDLNNLEWTPIGCGETPFEGNFNGNNFTISNLKISKAVDFTIKAGGSQINSKTAGLFGFCGCTSLYGINISNAVISPNDSDNFYKLAVGTLVGCIESPSGVKISEIKIKNSELVVPPTQARSATIGGMIGLIKATGEASSSLKKIQCTDVSVLYGENFFSNCVIGGLVGDITTEGYLEISDFVSYLSTEIPYFREGTYYFGAFGNLLTVVKGQLDLTNGFSKLNINQREQFKYGNSNYATEWYSISGHLSTLIATPSYNFKNLFGVVVEIDEVTKEQQAVNQLYIPATLYTESNCVGCEALPEGHNFDSTIWDLSDVTSPKLK